MKLEKEISQKIVKLEKSRSGKHVFGKKKVGMLVAGVHPEEKNKVVVGYSLCHKKYDEFDKIGFKRVPGHGRAMAVTRAVRWNNAYYVNVPPSIHGDFFKFVERCKKYYKDKELVPWIENVLKCYPTPIGYSEEDFESTCRCGCERIE